MKRTSAILSRVFLDGGLDGLIATNTTLDREAVAGHPRAGEAGGLSGRPVFQKSNEVLRPSPAIWADAFRSSAWAAFPRWRTPGRKSAPAQSLVQIYTSFIYQGPTAGARARPRALKNFHTWS